jgi:hypothetical protein
VRYVVLVASALALAGCGGGGTGAGETAAAPSRDERCTNVPAAAVTEIAAKVKGGGTLRFAQAVQSLDYESPTFFVSAQLASGDVGTWATSKLGPGGTIYAVDDVAKAQSTWPAGDTSSTYVSMIDDGAELSRDCVGAVAK